MADGFISSPDVCLAGGTVFHTNFQLKFLVIYRRNIHCGSALSRMETLTNMEKEMADTTDCVSMRDQLLDYFFVPTLRVKWIILAMTAWYRRVLWEAGAVHLLQQAVIQGI